MVKAQLCFHLALVAEYTGSEDGAAFLMGYAVDLEPDLTGLDEFHASVSDRLLPR
jgi:hypothetical protein